MDKYDLNVSKKRSRWQLQSLWWIQKYFVCEHHFKADEIRVSLGIGRKTLKPGAIPSILNFKNPSKIKPMKSPKKKFLPVTNESTSNDSYLEEELETNSSNDLLLVMHSELSPDRTKLLEKEVDNLKNRGWEQCIESWKWHSNEKLTFI